MQARPLILSALAGGLVLGILASQAVPVEPHMADAPAWRALIQPQYQLAYTPAYGRGPEDTTISATMALEDETGTYTLPPEYAAAERFARQEAKAAAEAERRYRVAYAEAIRPLPETAGVRPVEAQPAQLAEAKSAEASDEAGAKVITVAALTDE